MEKQLRAWSQGDIVLLEEELPKDAIEVKNHDGVLAYGEATGHSHRIAPNQARFFRSEKGLYLTTLVDFPPLLHEDHPTFKNKKGIPKGTTVRYFQEREVDWIGEAMRNVVD